MNKLKLLQELSKRFENFKIHPDLVSDIQKIISESGNEKAFLSKLSFSLNFLKTYGREAHLQSTNQFEKLKKEPNLYSMHIQMNNFNIRILYSFLKDGTVLLHGFYERQGKFSTDYTPAIPVARKRYHDMEENI